MMRQIIPVTALLLGSFFLLFAGGINAIILPVRGAQEGFETFSLGLLGTGFAIGYVTGCLMAPRLVASVGHIRAFSVMCAVASLSILASFLLISPPTWIVLRALTGFAFAGAAMIVESWLGERATPETRGRIFGIYTMVNLAASTGGQLTISVGDTGGAMFFVLAAMFYTLALVPTAASTGPQPKPLVQVRLDIRALWRNSPVAVFSALMVGVSNSAFGTLSAVYAVRIGLPVSSVALFASIGILVGALVQMPVGYLSDRTDRRKVLIGVAGCALLAEAVFVLLVPESPLLNVALAGFFGAAIFSMYPLIVTHAQDHADPGALIQTSGGLLLLYGIGAILGPLAAGTVMEGLGPQGMFVTSFTAHVLLIGFALWRISRRAEPRDARKVGFHAAPIARNATPQTVALGAEQSEVVAEEEAEAAATHEGGSAESVADTPSASNDPLTGKT